MHGTTLMDMDAIGTRNMKCLVVHRLAMTLPTTVILQRKMRVVTAAAVLIRSYWYIITSQCCQLQIAWIIVHGTTLMDMDAIGMRNMKCLVVHRLAMILPTTIILQQTMRVVTAVAVLILTSQCCQLQIAWIIVHGTTLMDMDAIGMRSMMCLVVHRLAMTLPTTIILQRKMRVVTAVEVIGVRNNQSIPRFL